MLLSMLIQFSSLNEGHSKARQILDFYMTSENQHNLLISWIQTSLLKRKNEITFIYKYVPFTPPSRENFPFLKEYKNKIIHLVLPHFNFWPA